MYYSLMLRVSISQIVTPLWKNSSPLGQMFGKNKGINNNLTGASLLLIILNIHWKDTKNLIRVFGIPGASFTKPPLERTAFAL